MLALHLVAALLFPPVYTLEWIAHLSIAGAQGDAAVIVVEDRLVLVPFVAVAAADSCAVVVVVEAV